MCSNDYDWEPISHHQVTTRKPHECAGCSDTIPAGSMATRFTGKSEGEMCTGYTCQACEFCAHQPDHTALHICFGDMQEPDSYSYMGHTHTYVRYCFANGETPTATGLQAALDQHAALAALEDA